MCLCLKNLFDILYFDNYRIEAMDGKSRLPTMIKKPTSIPRSHIPTDRLAANTINKTMATNGIKPAGTRTALTSFESVMNSLRNGAPGNKPKKRHASPEFRAPKPPSMAAKKLRRSRSVSDLDSILNLVQIQNRDTFKRFAMPKASAKCPSIKPALGADSKMKSIASKMKPVVSKPAPVPAHKRVVLNSNLTAKKDDAAKAKVPAPKKIPAYDFKSRFHDLAEKHKILKDKHERLKEQLGEFESLPEQYDECRAKLGNLEVDYKSVQNELSTLKEESDADKLKIKSLNDELNAKIEECRIVTEAKEQITQQFTVATTEISSLKSSNTELETQLKEFKETIEKQAQEIQEAADQLYRANIDRKDLHNTIMDLRGNIRVFCRVRPPLDGEENRTLCSWQHNDETSLEIGKHRKFIFYLLVFPFELLNNLMLSFEMFSKCRN